MYNGFGDIMPKLPIDILKRRVKQELALCNRKVEHQIEIKGDEIRDVGHVLVDDARHEGLSLLRR